jgi:uncharacterized repeat protein (TIGR03803 family)
MLQRKLFVFAWFAIALVLGFASSNATAQTYTDLHDFNCNTDGCSARFPNLLAQGRDGNLYGTLPEGGACTSCGTVFRVTPSGVFTVFYNFDRTTGAQPYSGLTLGLDGNFYGTTIGGGANGYGTAFRISSTGALTTLHDFSFSEGEPLVPPILAHDGNYYAVTDGETQVSGIAYRISANGVFKALGTIPQFAWSPLMHASDGYFYGSLEGDGVGYGSIFKMSKMGAMTTIYSFDGTQKCPLGRLVQDSKGYLYGTTMGNIGTIFKLTTKGVLTVLHDFDGITGNAPMGGLVLASDGNFYGGTWTGGSQDEGVLFQLASANNIYTMLYDAGSGTGGEWFFSTPVQHTNGTIYGLAYSGGAYGGGVFYSLDVGLPPFVALMTTSGTPGQTVQILGQGFNTASSVMFGSGSANFTVASDTYMTAVVPAQGTQGYVSVTTASSTLTSNKKFKVVPIISSFSPTSGPAGTKVTITGGGFYGATKVTFGGVKATSFTVDSGSQITATVPTGAVTGTIKVITAGGTVTSKGIFTVT